MKESVAMALIGTVAVVAVAGIAFASGSMVRTNGFYGPNDGMMGGHMGPGMMDGYPEYYGNWSGNYSYHMHMPAAYCWNYTSGGNGTWGGNYSYPAYMPGYCSWNQTWQDNYSHDPVCWSYSGNNETAPDSAVELTQHQELRHGCH